MMTLIRVAVVFLMMGPMWPVLAQDAAVQAPSGTRAAATARSATLLAQAQVPQQQDEFVPIDELPPQDQLPAAPLLVGAYAFVLLVFFVYVVSVSRRLVGIERDMARLQSEVARSAKG